jgi:diguanylate cyclase (GGDEF)-like protein
VTRPVRRLAVAARALSQGNLDRTLAEEGPKEVRVAATALNEAILSMRQAEAQADALADARLDDPVLSQTAPGPLGASLQAAVSRLATSLADEEDFRHRLAHAAVHDSLTKLANRNAIFRHLDAALARTDRSSTYLALLQIDIDDFKSINELHGHQAGDLVLSTIGQRLVGAIRAGDQAGRLAGDQFVVVAEPIECATDAVRLAERVVERITEPIVAGPATIRVRASVGVGVSRNGLTADELLRDTDLALFKAKSDGKSRIEVCDEELRAQLRHLSGMEQGIRHAIDNDEFVLHYQAAVGATDHRAVSLEALLRWERPDGGRVSPGEFIPVAERSELIVDLDRWVIGRAIAQLADWAGHAVLGSLPVSVNISGRHLGSGTVYHDISGALDEHGVDPSRLILEVTETAVLDDLGRAAAELTRLQALGVQIALDDFGTGYMSLAHLRRLPVDVLKIDRSFVTALEPDHLDEAEHSLVRLMVQTGHLLGMKVTAEGVETPLQADRLTALGTDSIQGFLFSRPTDHEAIETLLDGRPLDYRSPV